MSLDALTAVGIILLFTLAVFTVSAIIGLMVGRLGLVEREDLTEAPPAQPGQTFDARAVDPGVRPGLPAQPTTPGREL